MTDATDCDTCGPLTDPNCFLECVCECHDRYVMRLRKEGNAMEDRDSDYRAEMARTLIQHNVEAAQVHALLAIASAIRELEQSK